MRAGKFSPCQTKTVVIKNIMIRQWEYWRREDHGRPDCSGKMEIWMVGDKTLLITITIRSAWSRLILGSEEVDVCMLDSDKTMWLHCYIKVSCTYQASQHLELVSEADYEAHIHHPYRSCPRRHCRQRYRRPSSYRWPASMAVTPSRGTHSSGTSSQRGA